ncbi:hypothetical protein NP233_g7697 [Leucocoprinus birnbaumii]|uniref:F-box domain-containing protein n=1 Tax=Leucocoprinus birnbaumii TaxID=56174 RepID=A0AAD5VNU2_9AGAR|nr:hypothetical protein NP233_g7697 [Leucocoprinus birnbaumii]
MKPPLEARIFSSQVVSSHILLLTFDSAFRYTAIPASICHHCETTLTGQTSIPVSPIPHLIGSNAIPNQEQGHWIRGAVDMAMVDVRKLEGEIWRVKSVLAQLQGECRALEEFVDTHRAFLTPARRVYPEIWAEIFKYCPRGSTHRRFAEVEDSFDPNEGPMVLTQVCSAWRQIAISTPQLWTTIRLTYRGSSLSQQALIRTWTQRSGSLPLTIAVMEIKPTGYPKDYPPLNWSESEVLHELCTSSARWKELYLLLPASPLPWLGFEPIRHELHSLQKFISFSTLDVPLAQINRLEFSLHKHTPASIDTCLLSLDLVPNVQECVFHMGACEPWTTLPAIHHSELRSLTVIAEALRDNTQKGLARFFSNLSTPNLKTLVIHSIANGRQWDHYAIGHFLSRTPSLEALELKCDIIKANELLEELREATALTSLILSVPTRSTEELLDYLSSADAVNLLPFLLQLQSLSFEGLAKPDFVYRIGKMIACRTVLAKMNRSARLTFVKYDFSSSPTSKFDCTGHGTDPRESQFTVTRQSTSFVFRRRSAQFAQPLQFSA